MKYRTAIAILLGVFLLLTACRSYPMRMDYSKPDRERVRPKRGVNLKVIRSTEIDLRVDPTDMEGFCENIEALDLTFEGAMDYLKIVRFINEIILAEDDIPGTAPKTVTSKVDPVYFQLYYDTTTNVLFIPFKVIE